MIYFTLVFSWEKKMLKTLIYIFFLEKNVEDTHLFFFRKKIVFQTVSTCRDLFFLGKKCSRESVLTFEIQRLNTLYRVFYWRKKTEDTRLFFSWKKTKSTLVFSWKKIHSSISFSWKQMLIFSWKKILKTLIFFFFGKKIVFDRATSYIFFLKENEDNFFYLPIRLPQKQKQKALINKDLFLNLLIPTYDFFLRIK